MIQELMILNRLLKAITIRHNLFVPHMRLVERKREGKKLIRHYEMDTPLNRVLVLCHVEASTKQRLVQLRNAVSLVKLSEEIEKLSKEF